jgi:hypothetical protein
MIAGRVSWLISSLKESVRSFIPIIILLFFTLIGALIFMSIEGPNEKFELEKLRKERARLLEVATFFLSTNLILFRTPLSDSTQLNT